MIIKRNAVNSGINSIGVIVPEPLMKFKQNHIKCVALKQQSRTHLRIPEFWYKIQVIRLKPFKKMPIKNICLEYIIHPNSPLCDLDPRGSQKNGEVHV